MLGGSFAQIPAIIKAKEMGLYVITCDYLPENPGHKYADAYYNISTTDKDNILKLAEILHIDGIVCYASDPAAPTAAYVAENLSLPTSPYKSVEILTHKDLFREFLKENKFNVPNMISCTHYEEAYKKCQELKFPVVVKPVDSSGTKGVTMVSKISEIKQAFNTALQYTRCHRIIVEEYIESVGSPIEGDAFSVNGKLVFWAFADDHYDIYSQNPLSPIANTYPCTKSQYIQNKIIEEVQRLLDLLHMQTGAYNIEVRIDSQDNIYLMEVGPRNGGDYIPLVTKLATGVDLIEYTIKAALGEDCSELCQQPIKGFWSDYPVHSNISGKLITIDIDNEYSKNNMIEFKTNYKKGDEIYAFTGSNTTIGVIISHFSSYEEMMYKTYNFDKYVKVIIKKNN